MSITRLRVVFHAQSARLAKGKTVTLTGGYHFIILGDRLNN